MISIHLPTLVVVLQFCATFRKTAAKLTFIPETKLGEGIGSFGDNVATERILLSSFLVVYEPFGLS